MSRMMSDGLLRTRQAPSTKNHSIIGPEGMGTNSTQYWVATLATMAGRAPGAGEPDTLPVERLYDVVKVPRRSG